MQRWYWFQTADRKYIGKCFTSEAEIKQTFNCVIEGCLVTMFSILKEVESSRSSRESAPGTY